MEQNVVRLSKNAIEEIKSWREYAKSGVSFEKIMIEIIKKKVSESEYSDDANKDIRRMVEDFILIKHYETYLLNRLNH